MVKRDQGNGFAIFLKNVRLVQRDDPGIIDPEKIHRLCQTAEFHRHIIGVYLQRSMVKTINSMFPGKDKKFLLEKITSFRLKRKLF